MHKLIIIIVTDTVKEKKMVQKELRTFIASRK